MNLWEAEGHYDMPNVGSPMDARMAAPDPNRMSYRANQDPNILLEQIKAKYEAEGPNAQFTPEELELLARISDTAPDEQIKRQQGVGDAMLAQGLRGSAEGGTYGRYGIPMPYSRGQALADALRTGAGAYLSGKAGQAALARGREQQQGKKLYADRSASPLDSQLEYDIRSRNEADLAKLRPTPLPKMSMADRLRGLFQ